MRQTFSFHITGYELHVVEIEEALPTDVSADELPTHYLALASGPNMAVSVPLAAGHATELAGAIAIAGKDVPADLPHWEPTPALAAPAFAWAITAIPTAVSLRAPEPGTPHWSLIVDDIDGGQLDLALSDALMGELAEDLRTVLIPAPAGETSAS
ncbi:hypothetical protein [Miltoncostaea oceani]|uniref:hypothetical protein n=1 Tax=Miltoncostaea oceani TaxID=2843216 RepID=UPI001C3CA2A3|nr:hypothetical protein [Miltoncostaea oceani]